MKRASPHLPANGIPDIYTPFNGSVKTPESVIASLDRASRARRGDLENVGGRPPGLLDNEGHTRTCAAHNAVRLPRCYVPPLCGHLRSQ
jgi:hypothetical protein